MNPSIRITPAVKALLIANVAVYLVQFLPIAGPILNHWCMLVPSDVFSGGQVWRLVSYMFLHSKIDPLHILFNMLGLWMFGLELEDRWGRSKFLWFYLICGTGAALFSWFYYLVPSMRFIEICGASGAVLGLLAAFAFYDPSREVLLFFIIPMRVWVLVAGYAVVSLLLSFTSGNTIAHLLHFGGIVVAICYLKAGPLLNDWMTVQKERLREEAMRSRVKENLDRKRFYDDKVDPVLAKISSQGIESLTREEKKILKSAGKNSSDLLKKERVIPFEAFRAKKK
jgi:membrane associated rhomboid family serine protease